MQKPYRLNLKCADKRLLSSHLLLNTLSSSVRIKDFKEMSRWLTQKGIYPFMRSTMFAFAFVLHRYSFSFSRRLLCISPFRHTPIHWHFHTSFSLFPSLSLSLLPSTFTQPLSTPSHSDAWLYIWPLWRQPRSWRILLESIYPACAKPLINNLQAINCWGCWEAV